MFVLFCPARLLMRITIQLRLQPSRVHPAPSRALARGGARAFRHQPDGRNAPRSVARRPIPRHRTGSSRSCHLKRPAASSSSARTLVQRPPSLRRQLFRVADALRNPKKTVFDFRAHFCHAAPMETHAFGLRIPANAPKGQKPFSVSRKSGLSLSRPRAAV